MGRGEAPDRGAGSCGDSNRSDGAIIIDFRISHLATETGCGTSIPQVVSEPES